MFWRVLSLLYRNSLGISGRFYLLVGLLLKLNVEYVHLYTCRTWTRHWISKHY